MCNQVTCVYLLSPPSAVIWNNSIFSCWISLAHSSWLFLTQSSLHRVANSPQFLPDCPALADNHPYPYPLASSWSGREASTYLSVLLLKMNCPRWCWSQHPHMPREVLWFNFNLQIKKMGSITHIYSWMLWSLLINTVPHRHGGGWSRKINAWHLYTLMVYL